MTEPEQIALPPDAPKPAAVTPEGQDKPPAPAGAEVTPPTDAPAAEPAATPDAAPAAGEPPAEPEKPSIAAEVISRRDASAVAKLMREKRELEEKAGQYKAHEARLTALAEIDKHDDDAEAFEAFLRYRHGDKAAEKFLAAYEQLTSKALGVESAGNGKAEREIAARFQAKLDALADRVAKAEAARLELEARGQEAQIERAQTQVASYLKDADARGDYPHLFAEADDAAGVVFEILVEAYQKDGTELTFAQAAAMADEIYQPAVARKRDRYLKSNLLAQKAAGDTPSKLETSQSANGSRKSLTNADASEVSAEPPKAMPPPRNEQERLARSFAVLQERLRNG